MSNIVDERIVVLTFDNSQFESATKESMSTLDKLKASLNLKDSGKSLENIGKTANNISFGGLANNIETVGSRFTNLGLIGMTALQNITNSAVNVGKKIATAIPNQIIQGGWKRALNIEQAKFQIEGLGAVWDETSKGFQEGSKTIREAVNNAVKGTAYGLDEAAVISSQLLASGISDADEMESHLRSISGLAAMTGSSYGDLGRIYTQIAGQGRMMGDQLLQISQRGINAAATMKDYLNANKEAKDAVIQNALASGKQVKKMEEISTHAKLTEADIREMVSAGAIDFNTFSNAMNDAFGEHATKANETFTGSLANMKAALSRVGADILSKSLVNLRNVFNALTPLIDKAHEAMGPFIDGINKAQDRVSKFVVKGLNSLLPKDTESKLKSAKESLTKIGDSSKKASDDVSKSSSKISKALTVTKEEAQAAWDIWNKGTYGNGEARKKNLDAAGLSYKNVQGYINALIDANFDLDKVAIKVANDTKNSNKKSVDSTKKVAQATKETTKEVKEQKETLSPIVSIFKTVVNFLKAAKNVAIGILSIANAITDTIGDIFSNIKISGASVLSFSEKVVALSEEFRTKMAYTGVGLYRTLRTYIIPGFVKIIDSISGTITKFVEFISEHKILQTAAGLVYNAFIKMVEILGTITEKIGEFVSKVKDSEGFEKLKTSLEGLWDVLKKLVGIAIDRVVSKFKELSGVKLEVPMVDRFVSFFDKLAGGLSKFVDQVQNGTLFDKVINFFGIFKKFNAGSIAKGLGGASISKAFASLDLSGLKGRGEKAFDSLENQVDKLKEIGKKLADVATNIDWDKVSDIGVNLTKVVSLAYIAKKAGGVFDAAAGTFRSISGFFGGMSSAIKTWENQIKMKSITTLAFGVAAIVASMALLCTVPTERLVPAATAVASVFAAITGAFILIDKAKLNPANMQAIGISFAGIGAAMLMLAASMKIFAGMNGNDIAKSGAIIVGFVTMFALASRIAGSTGKNGMAFLGMAVAINILVPAMVALAAMPGEKILKAGTVIFALMASLAIASRIAGKGGGAASLLAMAVAVDLLLPAIVALSLMPADKALKSVLILDTILFSLAAAARIASASKSSFATLSGMTAVVVAIAASLVVLSFIDFTSLLKSATALSSVILALSVAIAISEHGLKGSAALLLALSGIATVIYMLGKLPMDNAAATIMSLTGFIVGISAVIALFSILGASAIGGALVAVAALDTFIVTFGASMAALGALVEGTGIEGWIDTGARIFGKLGSALGDFVGNIIGGILGGLPGLRKFGTELSGFMAAIQPFLAGVKNIDDSVITSVKNLAAAIVALTGAQMLNGIASFLGVGNLKTFGKQLNNFVEPFKEFINNLDGIDESKLKNVEIISKAMKSLTDMASSIPNEGGLAAKLAGDNTLSQFANHFQSFIINFKVLAAVAEGVSDEQINRVTQISKAAKALAQMAQEIPNEGGLLSKIVGDNTLTDFASHFHNFMPSFKALAEKAGELEDSDIEKVTQVSKAAKALAQMAQEIPNEGGLAAAIAGDNTLTQFAEGLEDFIEPFSKLATAAGTLPEDGITNVGKIAEAGKALANMAASLPDTGGLKQGIKGAPDLTDFANQLEPFSYAFETLAYKAYAIPEDGINKVGLIGKAALTLAKVANEFPDSVKNRDTSPLQEFAGQLPGLFDKFRLLTDKAANFSDAGIEKAVTTINSFKRIADVAANLGGGGIDLTAISEFATQIPGFGEAIARYANRVASVETTGMEDVSSALPSLASGVSALADIPSLNNSAFGAGLETLGSNIKAFDDQVKNINTSEMKSKASELAQAIEEIANVASKADIGQTLANVGKDAVSSLTSGMTSQAARPANAMKSIMTNVVSAIQQNSSGIKNSAAKAANALVEGIESKKSNAQSAGKSLASRAAQGAQGNRSSFQLSGGNAAQGFINGLAAKEMQAYQAGYRLGSAGKRGLNAALAVASPSKEFMKSGKFAGEGLVLGLKSFYSKAHRAGTKLGEETITGANNALNLSFEDLNPTITPVLDLTELKANAGEINSILNSQNGMDLAANINGTINQQNNDYLFIDAVNKLSSKIDKLESSMADNQLNPGEIYDAVRIGASRSSTSITLNDRELTRSLEDMGVVIR